MKIVFVIGNAFAIFGGAAISTLTFAKKLKRDFGHDSLMLSRHPVARSEMIGGTTVAGYRDLEELKTVVRDFQPGVIVGALGDAIDACRIAHRYRVPFFLYLHSYEFCAPTADEAKAWGLPAEAVFPPEADVDFLLGSATAVFACSRHIRDVLEKKRRRPSEVLYYDFDDVLLDADQGRRPEHIVGICGYRHKGLEIFLQLARRFPRERFLLAGAVGADIDLSYRRQLESLPNLVFTGRLGIQDLLGRSKIVLVPSLWPEPFGRIAVEALANGIPILASSTGGLQEILQDGPMALKNFRNVEAWAARLQGLLESDELRAFYAAAGRKLARPFIENNSTAVLEARLKNASSAAAPDFNSRKIVFFGAKERLESDSLVNFHWSQGLAATGRFSQSFGASEFTAPDFTIHHDYTRHFSEFTPPETGLCVAVRTSDFGPYPPAWAAKINRQFDQLWVHTDWIRQQAAASGIDPARVSVVPLGIDPAVFRPDGPAHPLQTKKSFRFVFVGTAVVRKGFDTLLSAYRRAFTREDDVCLVIKDHSANAFHTPTYREAIQNMMSDERAPDLIYIDAFFTGEKIASLFRACHVGVFPYRAEGFCLPILEAMACGIPSIVPNLGACVDFCSEKTSFVMPALRIKAAVNRRFALKIGVEENIAAVDFCEVRVETLICAMREAVAASKDELKNKAQEGVRVAHNQFTWQRSAERVAGLLDELSQRGTPVRLERKRREAEKSYRQFEAARRLMVRRITGASISNPETGNGR
jgi:glycosyltransferase involved in cell wall biosynthesis